jgi:hypothetical protein
MFAKALRGADLRCIDIGKPDFDALVANAVAIDDAVATIAPATQLVRAILRTGDGFRALGPEQGTRDCSNANRHHQRD